MDLLTTLRGQYAAQGSRDLALAAFFLGPEQVARVRQKLRQRPPEWLTLERLASRLPRREARTLRYVREARTRAILYGLAWPVEHHFRVTSGFGPRIHPILGGASEHRGVDIGVPVGTEVRAPAAGVVAAVRESKVNGRWLKVRHEGGVRTVYCHLSLAEVKPGQKVGAGEVLARSGETGRVTGPLLLVARPRGELRLF
ncbi:M23 family metallopeptidase [Archangium gephyra]|nr:M23 family metallopeptidase [Archangium gephyra]